MTVDELARHLDGRLDKQDEERRALAEKVTALQISTGKVETALAGAEETCKARHESVSKKIAVRDKFLGLGVVAVIGAAGKLVWDSVTKGGK